MPEFCKYANCHNLGSSTYQGYCTKEHQTRGSEYELLMKVIEKHPAIGTIKEARQFLQTNLEERKAPKTPSPPTTATNSISENDH